MKTYVLLSEKKWHQVMFDALSSRPNEYWLHISTLADFSLGLMEEIYPDKIFIPHWSYIIPAEIFENFECIVFHMTDLPYGRGGSPLQNLIVRGHKSTMISALRVNEGIDTGHIYLKKPLDLSGTANDIFERSVPIIESMINEILDKNLTPIPQKGNPTLFKRRKPEDGNLDELSELKDVYDYIRMLDAPGYPRAFLETKYFKIEFSNANFSDNKQIKADVRIIKK